MKVYRGTVDNVVDITNTGMLWVNLPFAVDPVPVTYVSPFSNIDSGFFAVPTPTSEVLVMEIDSEDTAPGKGSGLYYLGSIVGVKQSEANDVDYTKLDLDTEADITAAASLKPQNPRINWTSMGRDSKYPPSIPEAADDAYEANAVTPEKIALEDNANNALVLANQGRGGKDGYQNTYAKLKTGRGKQVVLNDSPRQNFIKIDAELSEADIIEGGKETILKYRPTLQVEGPHTSDMILDMGYTHVQAQPYQLNLKDNIYIYKPDVKQSTSRI